MKCWVGIDLGSTTTKAVILDDNQAVLGRGITNSRSNYDVACNVAKGEAFANVRFTLCGRELVRFDVTGAQRAQFLTALELGYRRRQYEAQLAALREEMLQLAPSVEAFFPGSSLAGTVEEIVAAMQAGVTALFAPGTSRKSDFFRDVAQSQYHGLAQARAVCGKRPFEALMAVYDKAILKVENREIRLTYDEVAGPAIDDAIMVTGLSGNPMAPRIREAMSTAFQVEMETISSVGTGYGRARLPFAKEQIRSEILCHGLGAHRMFPGTATVLDIGGQDTKAIQVDHQGIVTSFQMNDRCAAGCGRYLGYIADEMSLGLHELGPLAEQSTRKVKISSTCTVFAGAEIRDRMTLGQKREDILAGLHRAVMLRAMSLIARSGGAHDEFTFTGGVGKNVMAVRVLHDLLEKNYGKLKVNISPDSIYTGALGAALFAGRGVTESAGVESPVEGAA